ncbi:MAG: YbaK/EbsC family protein [Candidatus Marinimicrobia bacterium]|nr:YbaK/EbsC family protein [Candidatus Neomarinimicrobiota bacterium]
MPSQKLKNYLDDNGTMYITLKHSPAYTAQQIAAASHISGKELAKTVIVKLDGHIAMAVLPASSQINMKLLKNAAGAERIELAIEQEFVNLFPECEVGAMPPFGNLYKMAVYLASSLAEDTEITFNAGTHSELIKMLYKDYEKLVNPVVVEFTIR